MISSNAKATAINRRMVMDAQPPGSHLDGNRGRRRWRTLLRAPLRRLGTGSFPDLRHTRNRVCATVWIRPLQALDKPPPIRPGVPPPKLRVDPSGLLDSP